MVLVQCCRTYAWHWRLRGKPHGRCQTFQGSNKKDGLHTGLCPPRNKRQYAVLLTLKQSVTLVCFVKSTVTFQPTYFRFSIFYAESGPSFQTSLRPISWSNASLSKSDLHRKFTHWKILDYDIWDQTLYS